MKRYPFLFILLFSLILPVSSQPIYDLIMPAPENRPSNIDFDYGYLHYIYKHYNIIDVSYSSGEKYYIRNKVHSLSALIDMPYYAVDFSYKNPDFAVYMNDLHEISDAFNFTHDTEEFALSATGKIAFISISGNLFYCDGFSYGLGMEVTLPDSTFGIRGSYKPFYSTFKFNILDNSDEIPLNCYIEERSIYYKSNNINFEMNHLNLKPLTYNEGFSSNIEGGIASGKLDIDISPVIFKAEGIMGETTIDLKYDRSPFAKLDNFVIYLYHTSLSYNWKVCSITSGITGFKSRIGNDSYLDIWPLTFWDLFLASRNRLDTMDIKLNMPYASFDFSYPFRIKEIEFRPLLTIGYYHLLLKNKFVYKKKIWLFYPFLSEYEPHTYEYDPGIDGIGRIGFTFTINYKYIEFYIFMSQLLPVSYSKIKGASYSKVGDAAATSKINKSGGTSICFGATGFY